MTATLRVRPQFPTHLKHWKYEIERIAKRLGLELYPTDFQMVDHEEISELAAYQGFPVRGHHWSYGQESLRMKKSYRWGLHIIYEMVIPTNRPCYAYLLDVNPDSIQKQVMAHVYGHNDFFGRNIWFRDVPGNLHDRFGDNAMRLEEMRLEHGKEKVDRFLEACMSLDNLFNPLDPLELQISPPQSLAGSLPGPMKEKRHPKRLISNEALPGYMDEYINPPEWLDEERRRLAEEEKVKSDIARGVRVPEKPIRDILGFALVHAPLEPWQQEAVRMVREESQPLWKGAQTKFMNEGWAALWEAEIMAGQGVALDSEVCSFAQAYAGVQGGEGSINPYRLGKQLWDDIRMRWDTGRHGRIWNECVDGTIKKRWEEFIVFKSLYDEHGGATSEFSKEWDEFVTLVHETREGRGCVRNAFFLPENVVTEWLYYKKSVEKLKELQIAMRDVLELEAKARTSTKNGDEEKTAWFKRRWDAIKISNSPHRFWSSKELQVEIDRCTFYIQFKERISKGDVAVLQTPIPHEWVYWAKRHELLGGLGKGLEKMFEVCATHNDASFVDDFFTSDFCARHGYYTIGMGKSSQQPFASEDRYVISSRNHLRVKRLLLNMLLGKPKILLVDANFNNNNEWRLIHLHDGRDICYAGCHICNGKSSMKDVMERIYIVWNRKKAVHLETIKTEWPKRKPPWYYWYPPGWSGPEIERPKHRWVRYSCIDDVHATNVLPFESVDEDIRKLLPHIPDTLE
ncbi:MAG TPA: SpoVR family protein [Candidatus Paceibacterota bacterium]